MSLSRAENIFMPANINSIVLSCLLCALYGTEILFYFASNRLFCLYFFANPRIRVWQNECTLIFLFYLLKFQEYYWRPFQAVISDVGEGKFYRSPPEKENTAFLPCFSYLSLFLIHLLFQSLSLLLCFGFVFCCFFFFMSANAIS